MDEALFPTATRAAIASRLRKMIEAFEKGNVSRFAREAGVKREVLSHALRGTKTTISLEVAMRIRERYNVSLEYIFAGDERLLSLEVAKALSEVEK